MSTVIKKRSPEELAAFFRKKKSSIDRLLAEVAPKKKKKKATAKKKKAAAKKKKKKEVVQEEPAVANQVVEAVEIPVVPAVEAVEAAPAVVAADAPVVAADDLTQLEGLGSIMAERLAAVGITTYADLAALSKKKSERVGEGIRGFLSKFEKKKWRQKAKELMKNK